MLNTITTTASTFSAPPLAPLNIGETYPLGSTNKKPFQTNNNLNATANQCQTLYQPYISPKKSPSAILFSPSSTVGPINSSFVNIQFHTVHFVALNKSVKTFDGLDHQYTPQELIHQIDAQMIFTRGGEHPFDLLAWYYCYKQKTPHIHCSLCEITLSWFLRLHEFYKNDWSAVVSAIQKKIPFTESWRNFAQKGQHSIGEGWCNESAASINLECNESFTRGLPRKLKDFAQERQVTHTSTVTEPSIPFHTLVKLVVAEYITNEKFRFLDLPLEIKNVTLERESQNWSAGIYDPISEVMFTQTTDPKIKSTPQFQKHCSYCPNSNHSVSNCFRK